MAFCFVYSRKLDDVEDDPVLRSIAKKYQFDENFGFLQPEAKKHPPQTNTAINVRAEDLTFGDVDRNMAELAPSRSNSLSLVFAQHVDIYAMRAGGKYENNTYIKVLFTHSIPAHCDSC